MVEAVSLLVWTNMHIGNPSFVVTNAYECIFQLYFSVTDGFYFCPLQYNSCFNCFFDKVIMACFFVLCKHFIIMLLCHLIHLLKLTRSDKSLLLFFLWSFTTL